MRQAFTPAAQRRTVQSLLHRGSLNPNNDCYKS